MICTDKICFIHLPKTGGTFVRKCMGNIFDEAHFDDGGTGLGQHSYPMRRMDQYTFGFIRNPFDWYVSLWCHIKKKKKNIRRRNYRKVYDDKFNIFLKRLLCNPYLRMGGVDNWIAKISFSDMHVSGVGVLTYMHDMMYKHADEVCKFENLRDETARVFMKNSDIISSKVGVLYDTPKIRCSKRANYIKYYNDESREIVGRMDKGLLEKYGYEF